MDVTKYLSRMILAIRELPPPHIDGGTEPGTGENPDDTWTKITSLDGLEGRWIAKGFTTDVDGSPVTLTMSIEFPTGSGDVEVCLWDSTPVRVSENDFITGKWAKDLGFDNGITYVNRTKTALKIVTTQDMSSEVGSDEEWKLGQEFYSTLTGDIEVSFSAGAPYIMTYTAILHKTSESTEPGTGENPDDTWTKITSFDGLEGTWIAKGFMTGTDGKSQEIGMILRYPVTNEGLTCVELDLLGGGETILIPETDFEAGVWPGNMGIDTGVISVNQTKTALKFVMTTDMSDSVTDEGPTWQEIQDDAPSFTGDITVAFSSGAPYTMTQTIILHKQ